MPQVNLLQLAAANGQLATPDPIVVESAGGHPERDEAERQPDAADESARPAVHVVDADARASIRRRHSGSTTKSAQNHRLTGSMNYRHINSTPDTTNNAQLPFPGFATTGSQQSTRWTTSESLRSTFGANLVNEFRVGASGGSTLFSPELEPSMWGAAPRRQPGRLPSELQRRLLRHRLPADESRAEYRNQQSREASTKVIENTTTWLGGKHNVTFGGQFDPGGRLAAEPDAGADGGLRSAGDRSGGPRCSTRRSCRARRPRISRRRRTCTRSSPDASPR